MNLPRSIRFKPENVILVGVVSPSWLIIKPIPQATCQRPSNFTECRCHDTTTI